MLSGVLPPARRASGQRRYDQAVLKQLAVVTLAREAGFTIREIRALFRDFTPDTTASTRWRSIAAGKLQELEAGEPGGGASLGSIRRAAVFIMRPD
jgi:DNA-binding transcriptional MerR regulator